jgi:hypothetical protein
MGAVGLVVRGDEFAMTERAARPERRFVVGV